MNDHVTLVQVVARTLQLAHKQLCALISFAAETLLRVTRRNLASAAPFTEWSPAIFLQNSN